jgi:two-component system, cell cycle response regulator
METSDTSSLTLPVPRREARRPYLMVIAGSRVGELHKLTQARTVVGRSPDAAIRVVDHGISREHVELVVEADRLTARDLDSTNGTYLNGVRSNVREIGNGDKLSIGAATFLVFMHQDGIEEAYQRGRFHSAARDRATPALKQEIFVERLRQEVSFSRRHAAPLSLILWEVDGYADAVRRLGLAAGAILLGGVAETVRGLLQTDDILGRCGPGRVAVACRETPLADARRRAENMRATIARTPIELGAGFGTDAAPTSRPVTASCGVAVCREGGVTTSAALMAAAEAALDVARGRGGNRVESAEAVDAQLLKTE